VSNVKKHLPSFKLQPNLLNIRVNSSFIKTYKKIKNKKGMDFVIVEKPKSQQMLAVVLARLMGKKFVWIQRFENPPVADFLEKLLIAQADKVVISSKKEFNKLQEIGVKKNRIHYQK